MQRLFHLLWIRRLKGAIASKEEGGGRRKREKEAPRRRVGKKPPRRTHHGVNNAFVCACVCAQRAPAIVAGLQQSGRLFEIVDVGPDPYGQISMEGGGAGGV